MSKRLAFLGPFGTFSHEAVLTQSDLATFEHVPYATIGDALLAVADGDVELAVAPIENVIEGTVSATMDALIFAHDLFIQREIVLPISLHLMAPPGVSIEQISEVWSYSHALAQCRSYLASMGSVQTREATSTAEAARLVSETASNAAAVAPRIAASLFNLDVLASGIEDHDGNVTRFVVVGRDEIAAPTGHDRTTIVCFQNDDHPGSLHSILGRFAARDLNLTKVESRPTKKNLGEYCFVVEFEGHVADDLVGDCLVDLQAHLTTVKVLGSYPVTGVAAATERAEVTQARHDAGEWLSALRTRVRRAS